MVIRNNDMSKCKIELRNFIEHYGLEQTEEALEELKDEMENDNN